MIELKKHRDPDCQFDRTEVIFKIDAPGLLDVIEAMDGFLKACGYNYKGCLGIVYDQEIEE